MSYHRLGQQPQDPYDISMCNPQYRAEAEKHIGQLRANIARTKMVQSAIASVSDNDLRALLAKYRQSNACPVIGDYIYSDELQALLDRTAQEAAAADEVAARRQALMLADKQGGTFVMFLAAGSLTAIALAVIATIYLLARKKD